MKRRLDTERFLDCVGKSARALAAGCRLVRVGRAAVKQVVHVLAAAVRTRDVSYT